MWAKENFWVGADHLTRAVVWSESGALSTLHAEGQLELNGPELACVTREGGRERMRECCPQ